LGDAHARCLADILRTNSTIDDLFLEGNQIGSVGAAALAWSLETNSTLKGLSMEGNPIGAVDARALCQTLKNHNMTIQWLPIGSASASSKVCSADEDDIILDIQREMEVYLDMNTAGRRHVLQAGGLPPPTLWSQFLLRQDIVDDPDMIFLFHKEQPQLFQHSSTRKRGVSYHCSQYANEKS